MNRVKKIFLTGFCFVSMIGFLYGKLVNGENDLNEDYLGVLSVLGEKVSTNYTVQEINEISQERMLRKKGVERWALPRTGEEFRAELMPKLESLGVINEVRPLRTQYDYVLIHAGSIDTMRRRVAYLEELYKNGIRFGKVVFLTGTRKLDPIYESEDVLFNEERSSVAFRKGWIAALDMVEVEHEAAEIVWDQIVKSDELRLTNVEYVVASVVSDGDCLRRANTADTILSWLRMRPPLGNILCISNNPYIPYQHATMEKLLKECQLQGRGVSVETVGPSAAEDVPVAVHLDNLARWLYTEVASL